MKSVAQKAFEIAQSIQGDAPVTYLPPSSGTRPLSENILPRAMFTDTRGYIVRVVDQINGCYEKGWFDECAVMMRRLLETLIIECFESSGKAVEIKNSTTGNFLYLSELVSRVLCEPTWNLGRITKKALPSLKTIGDQSAHSRRFNAHREDIDAVRAGFRTVCQELLYLAKLK
jgi:hypothetical protein